MIEKIDATYEIQINELFANENIVFNTGQNGGTSNNSIIINQLSDKLIEQYEIRIRKKDEIIALQRIK